MLSFCLPIKFSPREKHSFFPAAGLKKTSTTISRLKKNGTTAAVPFFREISLIFFYCLQLKNKKLTYTMPETKRKIKKQW